MLQQPMRLPDGQIIENQTRAQALDTARAAVRQAANEELPDLRLPVPPLHPRARDGHWPIPFATTRPTGVINVIGDLLIPAPQYARNDRVVMQIDTSLWIFPAMQNTPISKIELGKDSADSIAWSGNLLIGWNNHSVSAIGADGGKVLWTYAVEDADEYGGSIERALPLSNRILCFAFNRVVALDRLTGKPIWQVPGRSANDGPTPNLGPLPRAFGKVVANADFTVISEFAEEGVRLICKNTQTGNDVGQLSLTVHDPNEFNMELSAESNLVYSDGEHLFVKDLTLAWDDRPGKESPTLPGNPAGPVSMVEAGIGKSLVISEDRIAALWNDGDSDNGERNLAVRLFSLDNAQPIAINPSVYAPVNKIKIKSRDRDEIGLTTIGQRLYIIGGPTGIASYNLVYPYDEWSPVTTFAKDHHVDGTIFGRNHLVLLVRPPHPNVGSSVDADMSDLDSSLRLYAFARYPSRPVSRAESGRLDYSPATEQSCLIEDKEGIGSIQGVDGGIYYRTDDGKLFELRGAADPDARAPLKKR